MIQLIAQATTQPVQLVPIIQSGVDSIQQIITDVSLLLAAAAALLAWIKGKSADAAALAAREAKETANAAAASHLAGLAALAQKVEDGLKHATERSNQIVGFVNGLHQQVNNHGNQIVDLAKQGTAAVAKVEAALPGIVAAARSPQTTLAPTRSIQTGEIVP